MTKLQNTVQNLILPTKKNHFKASLLKPLGLLGIVSLLVLLHVIWLGTSLRNTNILGAQSDLSAAEIIALTNQARLQHDLGTLLVNDSLTKAAEAKARHMLENDYWSHEQAGVTPWQFMEEEEYLYEHAGENLAKDYVSAKEVVVDWLNSESHAANILSPHYTQVGVAVVEGEYQGKENTTLIVQMFGKPYTGAGDRRPEYKTAGLISNRRATNWVHEYPSHLLIIGALIGSVMTVILVLDITKDGKLDGKFGPRYSPPSRMWHN